MMGMNKRYLAVWAMCVVSLLGISTAEATIDYGYSAELIAVVGEPAGHAVFAKADVEGICSELRLVDLRKDVFTLVHSGECPEHEVWREGLDESHIRDFLPEEFGAAEVRVGPFEEIQHFEFDWREYRPPSPPEGLAHLSVHLRVNSGVSSMASNEVHSGQRCVSDGE